jgi:hypothetical protein
MCARIKLHTCIDLVNTKNSAKGVQRAFNIYYKTECLKNVTKASTSSGKGRLHRQSTGGMLA